MAAAMSSLTAALGIPHATSTTLPERGAVTRRPNVQCSVNKQITKLLSERAGSGRRTRNGGRLGTSIAGRRVHKCRALTVSSVSTLVESSSLAEGDVTQVLESAPSTFLETTAEAIDSTVENVGDSMSNLLAGFKLPSFEEARESVSTTINTLQSAATTEVKDVTTSVTSLDLPFFDDVKESFSGSIKAAQSTLESVQEAGKSTQEGLISVLEEDGNSVSEGLTVLQSKVGGALDSAQDALEDAADAAKESFSNLVDAFKLRESVPTAVKALQSAAASEIEDVSNLPVLDDAKESLSSSIEAAQSTLESVQGAGQSTLEGLIPALEEDGNSVSESLTVLQSKVGGALDSAQDALEDAADAAKESISNLVDAFKLPSFEAVKKISLPSMEDVKSAPVVVGIEEKVEAVVENVVQAVSPVTASVEEVVNDVVVAPVKSGVESILDGADVLSLQEAGQAIKGSAANTAAAASKSAEAAKEAVGGAVTSVTESLTGSVTGVVESTTSVFTNATDSVNNAVSSAVGSVVDSLNNVVSSVENAYTSAVDSAKSAVSTSVGSLQSKVSGGVESVTKPIAGANRELLQGVVDKSKAAAGTALSAVGKVAGEGYSTLRESLPAEYQSKLDVVQEKVVLVAEPTGKILAQAAESFVALEKKLGVDPDDPSITVAIFLAGSTFLGVAYWQALYGGYSGDLTPEEALLLLKDDKSSVLIDIRPQELRDQEGVPDLRRGARFRTAAVESTRMQGSIRGQVRNADEVDNLITAALILGLKQVSMNSKVVVMDRDGSKSKDVARALGKLGLRRRYRMEGGFKGWSAAGMRVRDDLPISPLEIIKEETEDFVEEVKPTPFGVAAVFLGIAAGVYAIIEYEKTLQLIGVVGLGTSIYLRATSYQTPEDFKKDLSLLQKPFAVGAAGIVWGLSLIDAAPRPALATSSNSVQEYGGSSGGDESAEEQQEETVSVTTEMSISPPEAVVASPPVVKVEEAEPQPQLEVETPSATKSS